jgi:hypothetical protein
LAFIWLTTVTLTQGWLFLQPASADLNKYEAAAGGEFNIGTARQYGEADVKVTQ